MLSWNDNQYRLLLLILLPTFLTSFQFLGANHWIRPRNKDVGIRRTSFPFAVRSSQIRTANTSNVGGELVSPQSERSNKRWENNFAKLKEYKKQHGHCLVPHIYDEDPSFGIWVHNQRTATKNKERREKLDSIGFVWSVRPRRSRKEYDKHWEFMFDELVAHQKEHGHCRVKSAENEALSYWIGSQRQRYKKGLMTAHQKKRLLSISPLSTKPKWEDWFHRLAMYQREHGHCRVKSTEDESLNQWVRRQRTAQRSGELSPDRQKKLESINCEFTSPRDETFQRNFQRIVNFQNNHGHCYPDLSEHKSLYRWCRHQRFSIKPGN